MILTSGVSQVISLDAVPSIVWLVFFLACLVVEIISQGLTSIWFCGGSLVSLIVSFFGAPLWLQFILFVVVTVVLFIFTRPIAMRYYNNKLEKTNAEELVGKKVAVTEEVDVAKGTGKVKIGDVEWTAVSDNGDVLAKDTVVTILRIEGVKVIVK